MKKFACLLLLLSLCVLGTVFPAADTAEQNLLDIANSQVTEETRTLLSELPRLPDVSVTITDQPIMMLYWSPWFLWHDASVEDMMASLEETSAPKAWILFDEQPKRLRIHEPEEGDFLGCINYEDEKTPKWITDLQNNDIPKEVAESGLAIRQILCLDSSSSYFGTAVYFVLEDGSFRVRYYDAKTLDEQVFAEEEFRRYSKGFYELVTSYEYNYDENGSPKNGGSSFTEYVAETPLDSLDAVAGTAPDTGNPRPVWLFVTVAVAVAAVAVLTVVTVLRVRKR